MGAPASGKFTFRAARHVGAPAKLLRSAARAAAVQIGKQPSMVSFPIGIRASPSAIARYASVA